MRDKCIYYQLPHPCPHDCNPCIDKVECAAAAGYIRSTNPQDALTKEPYPWKDEPMSVLGDRTRWTINKKVNVFDLLPKKPWTRQK